MAALTVEFPQTVWTVEFGGDEVVVAPVTMAPGAPGGGGAVDSVNGQTGVVVLDAGDVGADPAGTAAGLVDDLSGVTDAATARTNLGLGALATLSSVTSAEIVDGTIVNADIGAGAAIALSKLATDPLARANHTGTQAQSTVTNLVSDLAGKAATVHTHSGADLTSGTVASARLGSGAADASTFLRGDGTWAGTAAPGWYTDLSYSGLMGPIGAVHGGGGTNMGTLATGYIYFWRVLPMCDVTIDGTSVVVGVGGGAGALVRVGIYAADTTGMPVGSPLCDSGSLDCSAVGILNATFSSAVLKGGRFYWAFIMSNSATMQTRFLGQNVQNTLRAALELVADSVGYNYTLRRATATFPTPPTNPTTAPLNGSQSVPSVIWRTRTT